MGEKDVEAPDPSALIRAAPEIGRDTDIGPGSVPHTHGVGKAPSAAASDDARAFPEDNERPVDGYVRSR